MRRRYIAASLVLFCLWGGSAWARSMTDALGRSVTVPERVERIICSGAGSLRLATYLRLSHMVVAVDSMEKQASERDARPYALARPEYRELPPFGEFRGNDNPELILSLNPAPQVIFKTGCTGDEAESLQTKTGIPVIALNYGNLSGRREDLYRSLTLMGEVTDSSSRAQEVVDFFRESIQDLRRRTAEVGGAPSAYVGGIGFRGPHGLLSTEPAYPPFLFTGAENVAAQGAGAKVSHAMVDREALLRWDPQVIFVDLSTLRASGGGALTELRDDPLWAELSAVKNRKLYGVLPYNLYSQNFGNILADAYFVGSVLFPDRFADVDPPAKADDIYRFLVGEPVFKRLDERFDGRVFQKLDLGR